MRFPSVLVALLASSFPIVVAAPTRTQPNTDENVQARTNAAQNDLAAKLRKLLEEQRVKLHIPGLAFVAVKDDKVLYLDAIGLRDVKHQLPVTAETLFPIG